MARKSRFLEQTEQLAAKVKTEEPDLFTNKTAIYCRLSLYDIYRPDPDSMKYQIIYVTNYVKDHPDLNLVETYVDNGETGMNYARPAFQRLLDDIYSGQINCVVVKDLSRFGRNYIETGMYLQEVFPKQGVRFIAINDEYDSLYNDVHDLSIILKNILNDFFSREISRKVSASYDIKLATGTYVLNICPLGYKKDPDHPSRFLKDPATAPFVSMMFEWFLEGVSLIQIAYRLTEMKVPNSQRVNYLRSKNQKALRLKGSDIWSGTTVKHILENPIYVGDTVFHKSEHRRYTLEPHREIPKEEWVVFPDTHEPYITREQHEQILQKLHKNKVINSERGHSTPDPTLPANYYQGTLKCGVCGYSMFRMSEIIARQTGDHRYGCNSLHYKNKMRGHVFHIAQNKIDIYVRDQLLQEHEKSAFLYDWLTSPETKPKMLRHAQQLQEELEKCRQAITSLQDQKLHLMELFQDKVLNKADLQLGMEDINRKLEHKQDEYDHLQKQFSDDTLALSLDNPWLRLFNGQRFSGKLSKEIVQAFFDEILAYPDDSLSSTIREADWRNRLILLYEELEGITHDL